MRIRRATIATGIGATAFVLVAVVGVEFIGSDVPSLSILTIAVVAAVIAAVLGFLATGRGLEPPALGAVAGVAAFGYAVVLQLAVRYAVAATRTVLQPTVVVLFAALAAFVVNAGVWYQEAESTTLP
jgi:hypothetical protein